MVHTMLSSPISADFHFYTRQLYCSGFPDDEIEAQMDSKLLKAAQFL